MRSQPTPQERLGPLLEEDPGELYEDAPCGYVSAAPDGELVKVNQTLLRWTGYAREELLGRRFQDLLTPGGRIYHETHYAPLLRMQGAVREIALDLVCADGRRLPVLVNSVLRTGDDGQALLVRTTVFDATHRRQYERELVQAREREREALRRVERLHRLSAALAAAVDTREMAAAAVAALAEDLGADDVALALVDPQTRQLEVAGRRRAAGSGEELSAEASRALEEIMGEGRVLLWSAGAAACPVPWDDGVQALGVLPLAARGEPIGALLLTFGAPREFDEEHLAFMEACAGQCSQALERARLYDYQRTIAHALQQSLLAGDPPRDRRFAVASCYLPSVSSLDVGGDWHDTFAAADDTIGVVVGDVVGHGIEAATAMGQLRSAARALGGAGFGPAEVLERLDRFVDQLPRGRFATVAYAELELHSGRLRYSSAGHPPPLLLQPGEPGRLLWDGRSIPLGARLGPRPDAVGEVSLQPGARLVLYTDGLIERRGKSLDEMLATLVAEAEAHRDLPVDALHGELVRACVGDGRRDDDVCVLCLQYAGDGELPAATA